MRTTACAAIALTLFVQQTVSAQTQTECSRFGNTMSCTTEPSTQQQFTNLMGVIRQRKADNAARAQAEANASAARTQAQASADAARYARMLRAEWDIEVRKTKAVLQNLEPKIRAGLLTVEADTVGRRAHGDAQRAADDATRAVAADDVAAFEAALRLLSYARETLEWVDSLPNREVGGTVVTATTGQPATAQAP